MSSGLKSADSTCALIASATSLAYLQPLQLATEVIKADLCVYLSLLSW